MKSLVRMQIPKSLQSTVVSIGLCLSIAACDSSSKDDPTESDVLPNDEEISIPSDNEAETEAENEVVSRLYLNIENITVAEGQNSTPTLNNTVSLDNVIDAPSADAEEIHNQTTHVWHTGPQLELLFDFQQEYVLDTVHFWNYFTEQYDVDNIELVFSDAMDNEVGRVSLTPQLGAENPVKSEDFDIELEAGVRFVRATIMGSNMQSDFQNMGFTAIAP